MIPTRSHHYSRDGVALIMVLAFIVLLTILLVGFIAFTRLNRVSTTSYSKAIQAEEIAQGGLQDILGDLHNEILAGSAVYATNSSGGAYTNSYAAAYIPTTNLTAVPARIGYPNTDYGTDATPTALSPTLIRVSRATGNPAAAGGDTFFSAPPSSYNMTNVPGGAILNRASLVSTTNAYSGGRYISAARWNKSYLLATNVAFVPSPFTNAPPDWVYVTRTGSRVCTAAEVTAGLLKPSATLAANYGPVTPGVNPPASPVVGRYAFVMYDEGALLDANVAGYTHLATNLVSSPADPTTGMTQTVNGKSWLAYADLTQLPGLTNGQTTVDNFVNWRNASATATGDSYLLALISYSRNGFLNFATGDSPLLSRQDLINYFASIDPNINTTSATFSRALPYLGTFSRAVSAPSWTPTLDSQNMPNYVAGKGTPVAYKDNAEKAGIANRDLANVRFANAGTITHYYDDLSGATPTATYTVNVGDPLLQNRFSLAKINWLSSHTLGGADPGNGANPVTGAAPSSTYATAIQACFGLVWGSPGSTTTNSSTSTSTANGGNPCWNYVGSPAGPSGTLAAFNGTIETLDQVAKEGREPNFFELLKAAILSGSLGLGPGGAVFNNQDLTKDNNYNGDWSYDYTAPLAETMGVAGIFGNMLGTTTTAGPPAPATIPDMQIMQIGANIIDQFDSDSYPTAIYFPYLKASSYASATSWDPVGGSRANAEFGPVTMVYGDENLPLLDKIEATFCSPDAVAADLTTSSGQLANQNVKYLEGFLQPELWNPHQQPSAALANAPLNFEIRAYGSVNIYWSALQYDTQGNTHAVRYEDSAPQLYYHGVSSSEGPTTSPDSEAGTLVFSLSSGALAFYDTPRLLVQSDGNGIPNVNVNTGYGLAFTSAAAATSYAQSNFPYYTRTLSSPLNSSPAYTNHFAAFSAGLLGTDPTLPYYVASAVSSVGNPANWSPNVVGESFDHTAWTAPAPAGAYPFPCASFALGWYPSGSPTNFHPYSFITGIFAQAEQVKGTGPTTIVGSVQAENGQVNPMDWGLPDPRTNRFSHSINAAPQQDANTTWFPSFTNGSMVCPLTVPVYYSTSTVTPTNFVSPTWLGQYKANIGFPQYWITNSTVPPAFAPGDPRTTGYMYPSSGQNAAGYYADPDGVVRPGDGYYINFTSGDGNMLFTSNGNPTASTPATADPVSTSATYNDSTNVYHGRRPVILNRPFRSVGELGYVFRDLPFKTLDMFSKSSADAALLDVFSLTDESTISNDSQIGSVVAGQFNPSNAPVPVLQAVLAGGSKKDLDPTYNIGTEVATMARNCVNALGPSGAAPNPLMNRAALATQMMPSAIAAMTPATFNSTDMGNKAYLEAPVRALADVTNTRTWNLLIDIIAQSGQMSSTATSLNDFVVQGEKRYWLHIAIDRYTGKIVDQQLEPVYE